MAKVVIALRALLAMVGMGLCIPVAAGGSSTPHPDILIANPGHCIAPADVMRRNHPEMLKHQRDITVHAGTRGARVSLNSCIECHASRTNQSVLGTTENFCQSCHEFLAVRLDCFECHQPSPAGAPSVAISLGRP